MWRQYLRHCATNRRGSVYILCTVLCSRDISAPRSPAVVRLLARSHVRAVLFMTSTAADDAVLFRQRFQAYTAVAQTLCQYRTAIQLQGDPRSPHCTCVRSVTRQTPQHSHPVTSFAQGGCVMHSSFSSPAMNGV